MADDRHDDIDSGDTGATGRAPRPTPSSDKEFDDLDQSFTDLPDPDGPRAFFEEDEKFMTNDPPPPAAPPVEDFGFDDIAQGDEPVPGSRRSSRRGGLRAAASGAGSRAKRSASGSRAGRAAGSARRGLSSRGSGGGGRPRRTGGGGGGGRRPGASGSLLADPRARFGLIALVALLILLVLIFWWRDYQRTQLENSYKSYINGAGQLAGQSSAEGKKLMTVLQNTDNKTPAALATQVKNLATEARGLTQRSAELSPPSGLADANRALQMSLRMRANGLHLLAQTIPQAMRGENQTQASRVIANGMKRFLASDVVYDDEFAEVARAKVREQGIDKVEVATTVPFLAGTNEQYAYQAGATALLKQMKGGGSTAPADPNAPRRGTSVESVTVEPPGTQLSDTGVTDVVMGSSLQWQVTVKNGGESDEQNVKVTVSLGYGTDTPAYTKSTTIASFPKGTTKTVSIVGPDASQLQNDTEGVLTVESAKVPNETNVENNTRDYQVKITFG